MPRPGEKAWWGLGIKVLKQEDYDFRSQWNGWEGLKTSSNNNGNAQMWIVIVEMRPKWN